MGKFPEYASFAALTAKHEEHKDFTRIRRPKTGSRVVLIAPHGGCIEPGTAEIATEIAGEEYSLYCFRALIGRDQANLHITSNRFDDPDCVEMVARHPYVLAVHGWGAAGNRVVVGGRDEDLGARIRAELGLVGIDSAATAAGLTGKDPSNICNRGSTGRGVQLELTMGLRHGAARRQLVEAVRRVLAGYAKDS